MKPRSRGRSVPRKPPAPPTPHDALFKATFSQVRHARSLLRSVLPPALAAAVDWSTLRRRPGSFVNEELTEQHTDLLFHARFHQRTTYFYLLFEHQSSADRWMLLRLLEYMTRVWREHLAKQPTASLLPVIVPVVLHHSETGWTCATAFEELMDLDDTTRPHALPYVPCFRLILDDVSHATDDDLRARAITALAKLVLACFHHARDMRSLLSNLRAWNQTMAEVRSTSHGLRAFALVLRYIFHAVHDLGPGQVRALVEGATDPDIEEEMLSLADKLLEQGRQEGRQEGLQKGLQKGRAETVLKLLKLKFGKVPQSAAVRVRVASEADLDRWTERILTAGSLAEVLGA